MTFGLTWHKAKPFQSRRAYTYPQKAPKILASRVMCRRHERQLQGQDPSAPHESHASRTNSVPSYMHKNLYRQMEVSAVSVVLPHENDAVTGSAHIGE